MYFVHSETASGTAGWAWLGSQSRAEPNEAEQNEAEHSEAEQRRAEQSRAFPQTFF